MDIKFSDPPTSPSLISLNGFCGRKVPCFHTQQVSRCGLVVRRLAGKQKDLGSTLFGSPFSSKIVVYGHCLVTLPTQFNETSKWLAQLPTVMQRHSGGDSVAVRW